MRCYDNWCWSQDYCDECIELEEREDNAHPSDSFPINEKEVKT
jgi:hypothetical protein